MVNYGGSSVPAATKQQILARTNYGTNIYAHILREYYPDEVVMHISGRDCGFCRNPFNADKPTLHIWVEKSDPCNALSEEFALHHDTENAIPDGDAFSFAELHYHLSGDELLQTINKELNLHIGEKSSWYMSDKSSNRVAQQLPLFSFFHSPISNINPQQSFTLLEAYKYIVGDTAQERTARLRTLIGNADKSARMYKASNFDYCTFSGIFCKRIDSALINHSGYLCIDFDHVGGDAACIALKEKLLNDEYFETELLFRSPSGDGLKWIIAPDGISKETHGKYFAAVSNYISQTYGVEADKSGKDISRACFLPHDKHAFINPKLLNYNE